MPSFDREQAARRVDALAEELSGVGVPQGLASDGDYEAASFMRDEEERLRSALLAYARRVRNGDFKPAAVYR